ncbi:MAG TPA: site-specific integrase [Firmicutes bacterium]|nr:site-specific integrase [Candidatus Fermentithermobacillaceae bacterium]
MADFTTSRNTARVEPPRPQPREKVVPPPEGISRLIEEAAKTPILRLVILAMHTGMRRGELLALRWYCVDLEKGFVKVEWSLQRVDGQIVIDKPKSKKSRRVVPIDEEAVEMLRRMRETSKYDLVFHRGDGTPLDPSTVTHQFARIAERAGFKGMRFHDQRHIYATYALLAGVDLRVVQELLGHEDISTTANTYTHVLEDLKSDAAKMIASVLPKTGKRQTSAKPPKNEETES